MPRVSFIRGVDRRAVIRQSLELIAGDIAQGIRNHRPLIKPNLVSSTNQLAASHVDQVRGILDFVSTLFAGRILIAEASCHDTREGYRTFGYGALVDEYNVELVDLGDETYEEVPLFDPEGGRRTVGISRLLMDRSYYRISAAKIKTHDTVIVSLSVKNMAMGAVKNSDRKAVHCSYGSANRMIAEIAEKAWPDLAVIDGVIGMQGNGPTRGEPVALGAAFAGPDALAADRLACDYIGVDFRSVGYLLYCGEKGLGTAERDRITVIGDRFSPSGVPVRLHREFWKQLSWKQAHSDTEG